ncbi:cysteine-rich small domain-containing protein [Labilibacter marinus]|uniref:cysteine-rich small domain-containing protein n=1 Tax=Labilibacter marinus TaxID=1477105 RepID=UPI000834D0DB|nr:cysteine-rich small domain-containing protein [Labilibacter marinus]
MSQNYKFTQNKKCEYFPCHKGIKEEDFNCLFCYCPLYMLKDKCGGNFKYKNNVKDCSACTITHLKGKGYEHVMSKMKEVIKIGSEQG